MSPAPAIRSSRRLSRTATVVISVLATMLMFTMLSGSASAATPGQTLGVYAGSGAPGAVGQFESKLGRPVSVVYDAFPRESWAKMTDIHWWMDTWNASKYAGRVIYTVPMLPDTGGSLAEGATGAYNSYFHTLAERLVAGGQGGADLRLGHEFNGNWYKWSINVPNGAADYAAYWRQIVTTMRSVPGAHFRFDWCPNAGSAYVNGKQLKAEAAWPGDAYVDYVGEDIYDASWISNHGDADARWKDYLQTGNGLLWQRAFAAAHGKQMTFPEWGIANRKDGHGGGDSPEFIEKMYGWIKSNNVAYHMYFEHDDDQGDYAIFTGKTPKAAQRFIELFGNDDDHGTGSDSAGTGAAKLNISRVSISRRSQRLSLLATLAPQASGAARVTLSAGGRKTSFSKKISRGRLKVSRKISRSLARKGTGTVTVRYGGNATTRAQKVRLLVAPCSPNLRLDTGPSLDATHLSASGQISKLARGAVQIQLNFDVAGKSIVRSFRAKIRAGRWSLATALPAAVRSQLAQRTGGVHSYAIFTGSRRVSGAMRLYDVLGSR